MKGAVAKCELILIPMQYTDHSTHRS